MGRREPGRQGVCTLKRKQGAWGTLSPTSSPRGPHVYPKQVGFKSGLEAVGGFARGACLAAQDEQDPQRG